MTSEANVTAEQVLQMVGPIRDSQLAAILSLRPTMAQLEQAVIWANRDDDWIGQSDHPLVGKVADIFDILISEDDDAA